MECPNCGYTFDFHTCLSDEKAEFQDGDVSICFNCGEVHQLKNGVLELIDIKYIPAELQKIVKRARVALQMVKK